MCPAAVKGKFLSNKGDFRQWVSRTNRPFENWLGIQDSNLG